MFTGNHPPRKTRPEKVAQLSCEFCRNRKVKCDKLNPCSTCVAAGITCVPVRRKRLPRGRHVQPASTEQDLRERLTRLESLVTSLKPVGADEEGLVLASTSGHGNSALPPSVSSSVPAVGARAPERDLANDPTASLIFQFGLLNHRGSNRYMASDFWQALVEEVHGLRYAIDEPSDQESNEDLDDDLPTQTSQLSFFNKDNPMPTIDPRFSSPSRTTQAHEIEMFHIYLLNVDPIIRVYHRPSLKRLMLEGKPYLHYQNDDPAVEATRAAVLYSAVCSMTEEQCSTMFRAPKSSIRSSYQRACEAAIEQAGLVTTEDMTVLQAFTLYLVAERSHDQSRSMWTLIALAFRAADAIGVNVVEQPAENFFSREMRKRLWYTLCLLDLHAAFDRATTPLICPFAAQPGLPRNINDEDFDPTTNSEVPERKGFTDMMLPLAVYRAQATGKALNFAPFKESKKPTWEFRIRLALDFEEQAKKLLEYCDPSTSILAWYATHGISIMQAGMKLAALRPIQACTRLPTAPPPVLKKECLLSLSLQILENTRIMRTNTETQGFRWFEIPPWHPLAVAISECYANPDISLTRQAWPLVEASFERNSKIIADGKGGKLWRPIEKLMRKAREKIQGSPNIPQQLPQQAEMMAPPPLSGDSLQQKIEPIIQGTLPQNFDSYSVAVTNPLIVPSEVPLFNYSPALNPNIFSNDYMPEQESIAYSTNNQMLHMSAMIPDPGWPSWDAFVSDLPQNAGIAYASNPLFQEYHYDANLN